MEAKKSRDTKRKRVQQAEHAFLEMLMKVTGNATTIRKIRKLLDEHPALMTSPMYTRWVHINAAKLIKLMRDERSKQK